MGMGADIVVGIVEQPVKDRILIIQVNGGNFCAIIVEKVIGGLDRKSVV